MRDKTLAKLEEQVSPGHTALLVIDPQNDFCSSDGALAKVAGLDMSLVHEAVPRLNKFIRKAREAGVPVIWTRAVLSRDKMRPSERAVWGEWDDVWIVKKGTEGVSWYPEVISPLPDENVITKPHYDAFEETELGSLLHTNGVKTLLLTGFTSNVCVETTARRAYTQGYHVVAVSDCTAAPSRQEYECAILNIGRYFGKAASSAEIAELWTHAQGGDAE